MLLYFAREAGILTILLNIFISCLSHVEER
ncbi:MAG: hypothetical protein CLLPBCKN_000353 [Chroococcidiopsis cubana SAG 39.79]|nr:hypothetical protein [Chroococcidiopsis cubana SAG 39.79]